MAVAAAIERLDRVELLAMAEAANDLVYWQQILAKSGDTILTEFLGDRAPEDWRHYPPDDVYDPASHAQFFYHRHGPESIEREQTREHGHFHTFMRPRGMPPGTQPLVLPELAIADAPAQPLDPAFPPVPQPNQGLGNDNFSHLVAVAMAPSGAAVRLFTTNRWVTGETWYAAEDVMRMLDGFSIELSRPSWPLNRWLSALIRLYRPEIAALLWARDENVMGWRRRHRGKVHVFEDRRLETLSSLTIDPAERTRRVARALGKAA
jgi:hypothetical protein